MNGRTVGILKGVIAAALLGSLVVQGVLLPIAWTDADPAPMSVRVPVVVGAGLWVLTLQVVAVCIWRLLTFVRLGNIFSAATSAVVFRWVHVMIGAFAAGAMLLSVLAVALAPGEEVAPGVVGLVCGLALVNGGVALLVVVMRTLLRQATTREAEARAMQSELDEVI